MLSIRGKYQNGILQLEKPFDAKEEVEVIVTFLESVPKRYDKEAFLDLLKNGPVMTDEQYQDYLESRKMWQRNEIIE